MRRRLIWGATFLLVVVIVGLAVPFGVALSERLTNELGGRVQQEAYAVAAAVEDPLERGNLSGLEPLVQALGRRIGGRVLVTDAKGVLVADSQGLPGQAPSYASRPEIARALAGAAGWEVRASRTLGHDLLVSAVPVASSAGVFGTVRISFPMHDVQEAIWRSWAFLLVVGSVTLVGGMLLAAWLARWVTRPLATAAAVASRIEGGDLEARVPDEGPPEVRELARNMNSMTSQINDMLRAEREFAANASHQLRTPLTALRLSLEEAVEGHDPRSEAAHALEQTDRLVEVVESLLRLGQGRERGGDQVDLAEVAGEIAIGTGSGAPVRVSGAGLAMGDRERVRQVVSNLVDNARRFARARIVVSIEPVDGVTTLRVDDDGPGIPADDLGRVFDRFYRGGSPGGPGSGLGLSVARELVRADGGTIRAGASPLGGARFVVEWPSGSTTGATRDHRPDWRGPPASIEHGLRR